MKKIALLFIAFFILVNGFSQEHKLEQSRPKVGLILSGGGAKGLAHIGVLKVIEEAGVKIDYIGGTSIGAVIGGLYASGYSANQIDSIFTATNFDELLNDFIPRSSKNFYEKRNDELYALTLPFQNAKIGIPSALTKGMYYYNLLIRLTYNVRDIKDFEKLPIPFLCIATNIETGEEVVLKNGYLPQAMLASSALPTLISPIEIEGKLLIDGGVTNNYPIDELRKAGVDLVIGVDVQDDLRDRKGLNEATKILIQISNLQMIEKMKKNRAETDIYIKPDVKSFGVISFDEKAEIIKRGEEAAFPLYEKIKALAYTSDKLKRGNEKIVDSIYIKNIQINELENYTRSYVIGKLGFKPGEQVSFEDIKIGLDNLSITQNFSRVSYVLEKDNSKDNLNITLTENPVKTYVKFGLHYDGLFKTGILVNLTQKKIFFKNDVVSLDAILGDNLRYNFDYYVDNGFRLGFGFNSSYNAFNKNVIANFENGEEANSLNIDYSDFTNQFYIQTVFVQRFLLGMGLEYKHLKIKSETIETSNSTIENSDYISAFGGLKFDSFDNKYFPKKGQFFSGDFHTYFYSNDYTNQFIPFSILKGEFGIAKTFYKKITLKVNADAGIFFGSRSVPFFDFIFGGYGFIPLNNFRPFYGYNFLSISGDSYLKSTFTIDYEIFKKNHLNFAANYANVEDYLYDSLDWIAKPKYSGYAIGYGLETLIGPVEIKYSWSPELAKGFVYVNVGFWF
jgi:NTE family protein